MAVTQRRLAYPFSSPKMASWMCFRAKCGWKGHTKAFADGKSTFESSRRVNKAKVERDITVESLQLEPLCNQLIAYFAERMISAETLKRNGIMQKMTGDEIAIAFPYWRKGNLVNCKYRDIVKRFWQEKDAEKILYGLDDIENTSDIIIVEGEMDKLAMEEAGFRNCVSVPDGAPPSVSEKEVPAEEQDTKYRYLWNCKEYLKEASCIILATDGDPPGQALAEELARRLGRERCWRVKWPKKNDADHFKDANEVLMYLGPSALKEVIDNAELYPIRGLFNFRDFFDEIDHYYHRTLGYEFGVSTGWRALDSLYNVVPGELTIVTGVPNSGKSEWIDSLLCNLSGNVGWKFALCSMENKVRDHGRKLIEKYVKKPFFDTGYGSNADRMSVQELEEGKKWLNDTFYLIRCDNDALPNIEWVLNLARAAVLRHGIRGLVIDPYNELDHQRHANQTETEYVSQMLTKIKRFAQHHSCHVWFVAHPRQLHRWTGAPPNLYDISGSAHFVNKCDNGIVIHRNRDPEVGPVDLVQVCAMKVRNKVVGNICDAFLSYDRVTGIYNDFDERKMK
ncbi:twinkle homolog protein, chloroplastic/mitochondrial-like isoform X2 [Hibiscus syriacus]|uniref:twinkle homolog protein, chloroplastic/mitochondrial-like isoform X2 n=1 Tax=Hibiscus syriacus TaxID=106335 RepID=UPI001920774A|nr:twinkle homolog protein, chloroplastic/mitochondrial-like isoform X2 [Hibiscus syriacus]XP_039004243.1 twinkle homolog protein, chloroplastic/mitochondrial-like isoform X2 [Hibiscus syriacus]